VTWGEATQAGDRITHLMSERPLPRTDGRQLIDRTQWERSAHGVHVVVWTRRNDSSQLGSKSGLFYEGHRSSKETRQGQDSEAKGETGVLDPRP
jgi:hypothetical protein